MGFCQQFFYYSRRTRNSIGNKRNLLFGVCFTCLLLLVYSWPPGPQKPYITVLSGYRQVRDKQKILVWEPFWGASVLQGFRSAAETCPVSCAITDDKKLVNEADAVLFQMYDLWTDQAQLGTIKNLQTYREPNQVWVLFNLEPPTNMRWDLTLLNGLFNWTAWYRSDATKLLPYGEKHLLNELEISEANKVYKNTDFFSTKTKTAVGRISNCRDYAQRYMVVRELQKYIDVEMFGLCYDNVCGKASRWVDPKCNNDLKTYKFFLAFENAHCRDYITEKYWDALARDQIPIVNWKNMDSEIPIPGSYINVYDFKDLKTAAEYIVEVASNKSLYNSFFSWKLKYKNLKTNTICSICESLNKPNVPLQVYDDLDGWVKDDHCPKQTVRMAHFSSRSFPSLYI